MSNEHRISTAHWQWVLSGGEAASGHPRYQACFPSHSRALRYLEYVPLRGRSDTYGASFVYTPCQWPTGLRLACGGTGKFLMASSRARAGSLTRETRNPEVPFTSNTIPLPLYYSRRWHWQKLPVLGELPVGLTEPPSALRA